MTQNTQGHLFYAEDGSSRGKVSEDTAGCHQQPRAVPPAPPDPAMSTAEPAAHADHSRLFPYFIDTFQKRYLKIIHVRCAVDTHTQSQKVNNADTQLQRQNVLLPLFVVALLPLNEPQQAGASKIRQ